MSSCLRITYANGNTASVRLPNLDNVVWRAVRRPHKYRIIIEDDMLYAIHITELAKVIPELVMKLPGVRLTIAPWLAGDMLVYSVKLRCDFDGITNILCEQEDVC